MRAEIEYHTDIRIYEILDRLEHAGSLVAGMSSVGRTIACICTDDRLDSCTDVLSTYVSKQHIIHTKPQNQGIVSEAGGGLFEERTAIWHSVETL